MPQPPAYGAPPELAARVHALGEQLDLVRAHQSASDARAAGAGAGLQALGGRVGGVEAGLQALGGQVQALGQRLEAQQGSREREAGQVREEMRCWHGPWH